METTKTLPSSWKASLRQLLSQQAGNSRIAILGIGNSSRSDDAVGVLVARALLRSRRIRDLEHVLVIDGGHAPENMTGELRRFEPDSVLLVDAAEMGQLAGTIRWIPIEDLDGMSASTHSMPLSMLAGYLTLELQCTVTLIGIQARSNAFGEIVSPEVVRAIDDIVKDIEECLCECSNNINTRAGKGYDQPPSDAFSTAAGDSEGGAGTIVIGKL